MKVIFKFLIVYFVMCNFSMYANAMTVEEFNHCKASCYEQHKICLAECDELREQHKKMHEKAAKKFSYQKCRYNLENKKCLPALNTCVMNKCSSFFKA